MGKRTLKESHIHVRRGEEKKDKARCRVNEPKMVVYGDPWVVYFFSAA